MDAIEGLIEAIGKFKKEEVNLKNTKLFLQNIIVELQGQKQSIEKSIADLSGQKLSLETQIRDEKLAIYKRIEDKEKDMDRIKGGLTQDRNILDKEISAFDKSKKAILAENETLKAGATKVDQLRSELEAKLSIHRKAVETLR